MYLAANGPIFKLFKEDVVQLRKEGRFDVSSNDGKLKGRVVLVDSDPNKRVYPNGFVRVKDPFCEPGLRLRRFPMNICPHDYEGTQYHVLKVKRDLFEDLVEKAKSEDDKRYSCLSRWSRDRFGFDIELWT